LLRRWGGSSIAYTAFRPGNAVMLGSDAEAYIAYRVVAGVALALGDPVGSPAGCRRAVREFLRLCESHGWVPCFWGATQRCVGTYRESGLSVMQVAEDALIDLPGIEFRGKGWQDVRTGLNRAWREGVEYRVMDQATAPPEVVRQLWEVSEAWKARKGLPEMGFILGKLREQPDRNIRTCVAIDPAGVVHAYLTWLPMYRRGAVEGWTLDMLRRRPGAFNGVMEFLIARSLSQMREEGATVVSLSWAPLARAWRGGREVGAVRRLLGMLVGRLQGLYGAASLYAFKRKFSPRWEPVYLVYPDILPLPRITYAIFRTFLPRTGPSELIRLVCRAVWAGMG
jgi:lysylphosphatidylglycerol synthetase-like protein (DUF2156 family)